MAINEYLIEHIRYQAFFTKISTYYNEGISILPYLF